jgi:hypothetical protein
VAAAHHRRTQQRLAAVGQRSPGLQRQREVEQAAAARGALDVDLAAVGFDDLLGDAQAQSGAAVRGAGHAKELAEDLALKLGRDAVARVLDFKARGGAEAGAGLLLANPNRDGAASRRVADGVAQIGDSWGQNVLCCR